MLQLDDLIRPTWQCIHFIPAHDIEKIYSELTNTQMKIFRVSLEKITGEKDLLSCIGNAMEFPNYYGMNWDAFEECLRDMEWCPAKGYVLILDSSTSLWHSYVQSAGKLIESWLFAAQEWSEENISLHLIFLV
jgi:RNAse (barnase) inhibitor barstar